MLAVILTILKIIGIVLLSVLGLILVLAILALVLPVSYRLSGNAEEGSKPTALLKISYFLGLFRARADYTDALYVKVKVLFFTVFQMKIPDKDEESEEEYDLSELDAELETLDEEEPDEEVQESVETGSTEEVSKSEETEPEFGEETSADDTDTEFEPVSEDEVSEDSEDSAFSKLRLKFDEICDKIKRVRSEIRYYKNLYNSNEAKNALYIIKKRLMRILKKILPRRVHADVIFGFDSPDLTGKVYGLYTLFTKRFDKTSCVVPDFERKVFEGNFYCKGHFNIWCILWNGVAIILNRNVRKIYRSYKHHNKRKENEEAASDKAA